MGHHGDGLWRRDDCPIISHGGADESREDTQCDDLSWTNDISRGSDEQEAWWEAMMVCLVYYSLAEVQLRGTDRLHGANERKKPDSIRKKAQRGSHEMEQHLEKPSKSKCRKNDPHGH